MILAEFETSSFTFYTIGLTRKDCYRALKKAWAKHCAQTGAEPEYLGSFEDGGVNYSMLNVGEVLRDGEPFYGRKDK